MEEPVVNYDYSSLPSHVLAKVLKNLQFSERLSAIQTCKSWYYASWEPIISNNIYVEIQHEGNTERKFSDLKNLNRPFGKLSLTVYFGEFPFQNFFKKHGDHIREIDFSNCTVSPDQLIECLGYLTNLTTLKLPYHTKDIEIDRLAVLNTNYAKALNQNLQSVKIFHCYVQNQSLRSLRFIIPRLVNLETLEYSELEQLHYDPLINYFTDFQNLKLRYLRIKTQVKAEFFQKIANLKTKFNLHSLFLPRIENGYYDRNFEIFCMKLTNLRVLNISVTEKRLIDVCQYLTNLIELEISIPQKGRFYYVRTLQSLKKLVITSDVYDLFEIEENDEELIKFLSIPLQNLQTLHIRHHISSAVLALLCDNYKHITELKLCGLNSSNVKAIYKNMVNLRSLELQTILYIPSALETITAVNMSYDITNLKLLETVIILNPLPDVTLEMIQKLPNLKEASVKVLAKVLANLQFSERLTAIQTCKSWYYATWEPIISQNTLVKIKHDEHTKRKFSDLKNLNRPFGKLSLSVNFEKFPFRSFFKKHGHHIRDIVFSYCRLTFEQLIECLGHLTNLTSLDLSYNTKVFTIDRLAVLNTNYAKSLNQNLQSVKTFHCNNERECLNGLRLIMPMLINLETIEYSTLGQFNYDILLDYFKQFDDLKLRHLWIKSQVKADFFQSFANLKTKFSLHSLFLPRFEYEYYDRNFEIFCMKLSNLRVLNIEVTEKRLIDICRYLTKLNELQIAISRTGRFHFIRTLQTLKKLIITSEIHETEQNDADLIEFLSVPLQNLHTLHIRHHISSAALAILCDNYKHLTELNLCELKSSNVEAVYKNMINLRSLELHTVYFRFDQETTTDYDLDYNITNLKLLETLILLKPIPGATLDLIKQLPNLTSASMKALENNFNVKSIFPDDDDEPQEN